MSPEEAPKILSTWRKRGGLKRRVDFPSRFPERPRRTEQKADPWDIILFPFPKIVAFSESSEVMYAWARIYNSVHSRLRNAILILGKTLLYFMRLHMGQGGEWWGDTPMHVVKPYVVTYAVFRPYHPPSRSKNDRCSPMCL